MHYQVVRGPYKGKQYSLNIIIAHFLDQQETIWCYLRDQEVSGFRPLIHKYAGIDYILDPLKTKSIIIEGI